MERKINKHEDAVAIYFKVGFIDEDIYCRARAVEYSCF